MNSIKRVNGGAEMTLEESREVLQKLQRHEITDLNSVEVSVALNKAIRVLWQLEKERKVYDRYMERKNIYD